MWAYLRFVLKQAAQVLKIVLCPRVLGLKYFSTNIVKGLELVKLNNWLIGTNWSGFKWGQATTNGSKLEKFKDGISTVTTNALYKKYYI